jgi:Mg-chelatase subunit ChlD
MFCLFGAHAATGQTPLGERLRRILDIYVPRIEDPSPHRKPISILVITDGVPSESLDRLGDLWALSKL